MDIDFQKLFDDLSKDIADLAAKSFHDYLKGALIDGRAVIGGIQDKIRLWTESFTSGAIDKNDLSSLVMGQQELLNMDAVLQAGMAKIKLDEFKTEVCGLVVNTIAALI